MISILTLTEPTEKYTSLDSTVREKRISDLRPAFRRIHVFGGKHPGRGRNFELKQDF